MNRLLLAAILFLIVLGTSFAATNVSACGTLVGANVEFILNTSLYSAGANCITFGANNQSLDCNGFEIKGDNSSTFYGINVQWANATIKNCVVYNFTTAIYFNTGYTGLIENTTANTTRTSGNGIYFYNSVTGGNVINNSRAYSQAGAAIYIYAQRNSQIINSSGTSGSSSGIYLILAAHNSTITDSNCTSTSGNCIRVDTSSNITFTNVISTSAAAHGAYILNDNNVTFNNLTSTAVASGGIAVYFQSTNNSMVKNSNLRGNSSVNSVVLIQSSSNNITLQDTSINASDATYGISLRTGNNPGAVFRNVSIYNTNYPYYNLLGNNMLIDCQGLTTTGKNTSNAVTSTGENTTVQNCNFDNYQHGITYQNANNGKIENVTSTGTNTGGIGFYLINANYNTILNMTAVCTSYICGDLQNSNYTNITDSVINGTQAQYGAFTFYGGSSNNIIRNSRVSGLNGAYGITHRSGTNDNNQIINTTVTNASTGIYAYANSGQGTFIDCMGASIIGMNSTGTSGWGTNTETSNNTVQNCNISNFKGGIYFNIGNNNTARNDEIHSTFAVGYGIGGNAMNNSLWDNITTDLLNGYSYYNSGSNNNTLSNSHLWAKQNTYGAFLFYASSYNNTITSSDVNGYGGTYGITLQSGNNHHNNIINTSIWNASNSIRTTAGTDLYVDCMGKSMTGLNASSTYGLYSTQANTSMKNCVVSEHYTETYITGTTNATIDNCTMYSTSEVYSFIFVTTENSTLRNSRITQKDNTWGAGLLYSNTRNNTIEGNTFDGEGGTYAFTVQTGTNTFNNITNNTFLNATNLLYFGTLAMAANNNTIWGNNFSNAGMTPTRYIYDLTGRNFYNSSTEGNLWGDINSNSNTLANGTVFSTYFPAYFRGTTGAGVPYNISKSTRFSCNFAGCADYIPTTNTSGVICNYNITTSETLTTDITGCVGNGLNLKADNIYLDCDGHTISGTGAAMSYGVYAPNRNNVTIRNCVITDFQDGIVFVFSDNGNITNNTIANNTDYGVYLASSDNDSLSNNEVFNCSTLGVYLFNSMDNTVTNNTMHGSTLAGYFTHGSNNTILTDNTAYDNIHGYYLDADVGNNSFINNSAYDNFNIGIFIDIAATNNIFNNSHSCFNTVTDIQDNDATTFDNTTCDVSIGMVCSNPCVSLEPPATTNVSISPANPTTLEELDFNAMFESNNSPTANATCNITVNGMFYMNVSAENVTNDTLTTLITLSNESWVEGTTLVFGCSFYDGVASSPFVSSITYTISDASLYKVGIMFGLLLISIVMIWISFKLGELGGRTHDADE